MTHEISKKFTDFVERIEKAENLSELGEMRTGYFIPNSQNQSWNLDKAALYIVIRPEADYELYEIADEIADKEIKGYVGVHLAWNGNADYGGELFTDHVDLKDLTEVKRCLIAFVEGWENDLEDSFEEEDEEEEEA